MSDKTIISVFVVILVLAAGWYFLLGGGANILNDETVEGTIAEVDLSQTRFDGPAVVTILTSEGSERVVEVRTEGLSACPAFQDIADAFWLNPGEMVETRGEVNSEGVLIPCASKNHYFRVLSEPRR
jgi:hypothetical protein